jgi:hypothetical protein
VGTTPAIVSSPKLGDLFLKRSADATNGYVYEYTDRGWVYTQINLIGPEGSQGEPGIPGPEGKGEKGDKGDKGDPAPAIHILGVLSSLSQLYPLTPSDDYLGKGFIVKDGGFSHIYVCVISMEDPHDYVWEDAGLLSGYTAITVGGNLVNEWNADTKLTKQTYTTTYPQIYTKNPTGGQEMRDATDQIYNTDKWSYHTKSIALRDSAGAVRGPSPVENDQYATKSYVDNNSGGTLYRHDIQFSGYGFDEGYDGDIGLGTSHDLYAKLTIYSSKSTQGTSYMPIPTDYYNLLTNGPGPITIMPTEGKLDGSEVMTLTFYPNGDLEIGVGYQGQVEEYYWIKEGFENGYQNHIVNRVI